MERTVSTIDKNSLDIFNCEDFDKLEPINVRDLRVLIFMKANLEIISSYITPILEFLQNNFEIQCYVTEEVHDLIKEANENSANETESERRTDEESKSMFTNVDIDKVTIFSNENQSEINRIITIGGDGTVVQAIKLFYKQKCPSIISFGEESLGYLCCFEIDQYKEVLYHTLIKIAPDCQNLGYESLEIEFGSKELGQPYVEKRERVVLKASFDAEDKSLKSNFNPKTNKKVRFGTLYALNEIIVDRGPFNYLTNIECYINGHFLTVIQGDGVIVSSPTGSTAYSMSAGGSIVYNYVNSLLLTPICPHSLSFRPLILPDSCCITLRASEKSRCDFYNVSFDGDLKLEIKRGEKVDIEGTMLSLPFVTFSQKDPIEEWCNRLNSSLHWNSRPVQKVFTK